MSDKTWAIVDILDRLRLGAVLSAGQVARDYETRLRVAQRWLAECAERDYAESFPDRTAPTHRLLWRWRK